MIRVRTSSVFYVQHSYADRLIASSGVSVRPWSVCPCRETLEVRFMDAWRENKSMWFNRIV